MYFDNVNLWLTKFLYTVYSDLFAPVLYLPLSPHHQWANSTLVEFSFHYSWIKTPMCRPVGKLKIGPNFFKLYISNLTLVEFSFHYSWIKTPMCRPVGKLKIGPNFFILKEKYILHFFKKLNTKLLVYLYNVLRISLHSIALHCILLTYIFSCFFISKFFIR